MGEEAIRPKSDTPALLEKWPEPVDADSMLDDLHDIFNRYLYLPDGAAVALALWTVHTHAINVARHFPLVFARSPEKGCGKTTLLTVLEALVREPLRAANLTAPVLFRLIEMRRPTVLIDEADTFLIGKSELVGLLNSGHSKGGDFWRAERSGDGYEPRKYSTWGPKAIAAIGRLPEPTTDRSIVIHLQRKPRGTLVVEFTEEEASAIEPVRRQVIRWVDDNSARLRSAEVSLPPELSNRSADNWRPLLAIADAASPRWSSLARVAAVTLTTNDDAVESTQGMLLADMRAYFEETGETHLPAIAFQKWLCSREDRPWASYHAYGRAISAKTIAELMGEYGIKTRKYRIGDKTIRGYPLDAKLQLVLRTYVADSPEQVEHEEPFYAVPVVPVVPGVSDIRKPRRPTINLQTGKINP